MQGGRVSFTGQVNNYKTTVSQVVNILGGEDAAANYLSKCIYSVGLGSNDYLNNYFMPSTYSTSRQYTPDQYADVLIQQYAQQIRVSILLLNLLRFLSHRLLLFIISNSYESGLTIQKEKEGKILWDCCLVKLGLFTGSKTYWATRLLYGFKYGRPIF